jgi:DNA end-binding protein Ku
MAARAFWSGYIRLSLVAVPVRLYAATTASERVSLHYVDRETGQRVHYQPVVDEDTPIERERIGKGYEYDKDRYIVVDDEDLKKLKLPTSKSMEIEAFVPAEELDPIYFDKPFYVVPDGDIAVEAYQTLLQALQAAKRVAIGRVSMSGRERIGALEARGGTLMLTTLRAANEIRRREDYVPDIETKPAGKAEVELAQQLIKGKAAKFDPTKYPDRYQTALRELVEAKLEGKEIEAPEPQHTARVINLMDALRKSVAQSGGTSRSSRTSKESDHEVASRKAANANKSSAKKKTTTAKTTAAKTAAATSHRKRVPAKRGRSRTAA